MSTVGVVLLALGAVVVALSPFVAVALAARRAVRKAERVLFGPAPSRGWGSSEGWQEGE